MGCTRAVTAVVFLGTLAAGADWLHWRGPRQTGVAETAAPAEFSDTKKVAWKTPIPGRGFSTPVVVGNRLLLTTAIPAGPPPAPQGGGGGRGPGGGAGAGVEQSFVLLALDRQSGKLLWQQTVHKAMPHEGYHQRYGSFASYAPVSDGQHVWAMFGSYGLYCFTLDGKQVWKKELPAMRMRNAFGEGGSPALAGSKLILNLDQESGSSVVVLDKATGKELWRKSRDEVSSWTTPLVVESGGKQLVVLSASAKVRAYDLANGEVVWECAGLGSNVIPMPVRHEGLVIAMSGHREPNLLAIKLGRTGDLTGTDAIAWTNQRGNSYTSSPVLHEGKLYVLTDNGTLSCFNATTGEAYYRQQRLPKPYSFKSSPVLAGGKLYMAAEDGDVVVVRAGEQYEALATNTFTDQFFIASPVVVDSSLYLRSAESVYCIRE